MVQVVLRYAEKTSGSSNDAFFNVEWEKILKPNTKYKVNFIFNTEGYNVANSTTFQKSSPALLSINLTQTTWDIRANTYASSVNVIGNLEWNNIQTATPYTGYLNASSSSNYPIIINSLPSSSINVKIHNYSFALWTDSSATPATPANWVIILNFEEI